MFDKHTMDLPQEVTLIEKELLEIIIRQLEQNTINVEEAEKLAADFLQILPIADKKELLEKLKTFSQSHNVAENVYLQELGKVQEEEKSGALDQIRNHILQGNLEGAISVAKTHTNTT